MNQKLDLAIVCAMGLEWKALLKLLSHPRRCSDAAVSYDAGTLKNNEQMQVGLFQCGVGSASVKKNLVGFLDRVTPKHLLVAGLSGGLCSEIQIGDLFSPSKVLSTESEYSLPVEVFPGLKTQVEIEPVLLSSHCPLLTILDKQDANLKTGAVAVDMESYAIAKIAMQKGISTTILRAVSDDVQTELDSRLFGLLKDSGDPDYIKVLKELSRSPCFLLALLKMNRQARTAMQNLVDHLEKCDLGQLLLHQ